ncbi:hypothetical protein CALVIDRAFT_533145 [Calocera viscosa TUFC12733]|uniref:Uncharacterized protein n=1 Tax=Calocera viscosa (strain TUFC12733) TaxID=1330018 RepID=A0A167RDZ9_CALVF|nr:hypothetical protein CALVIDRAFT_533145 [Calocera viscosa TUFC12733]
MTSTSVTLPFNLTIGEESATWMYTPIRDGNFTQGWNSSYTGSTVWSGGAGIGQAFRRTQKDEAGFWMEWEGTALYLCLSTLDDAGYTFSVDGQDQTKIGLGSDPACSAFSHDPNHGPQSLLIADGLKYGTHTAKFNATMSSSQSSLEFYGGIVTLGAQAPTGVSVASTPVTVDDRDSGWIYQPANAWLQDGSPQNINGTHTYTCAYNPNTSASYTFSNTSVVQVIGIEAQNTFGYTVQLTNHNTGAYNSSNDWWTEGQTMYFADDLDPTTSYTITITNFNPNVPNGVPNVQNCFNLDAMLLFQPVSATTSPSSSSPSSPPTTKAGGAQGSNLSNTTSQLSAGATAGIAVGCVGLAVIVALLFFFLWHRRRQNSKGRFPEFALSEAGSRPSTPAMQSVSNLMYHPGTEPTPYVMPPLPAPPLTHSTTVSSITPRNEKGARRMTHAPSSSGSYLLPQQSPGLGSSSGGAPSSPSASTAAFSNVTPEMLHGAATVDLVAILNQRLRRDQADTVEEPPMYGEHP